MKKILLFIVISHLTGKISAQQNYCNFEGIKLISFGISAGILDSSLANPAPDSVNMSSYCARYVRDTALYDNLKIYPFEKLADVTPYLNAFQTPKITMKVYSNAPPGTIIELQLGSKSDDNYPSGVHSEFIGKTELQHAWQMVTFHYFQMPQGSNVSPTDIDKIVLLFQPNTNFQDTFYMDDLSGPELLPTAVFTDEVPTLLKVYQNIPNPAKSITHIKFQVSSPGLVSLKLYDLIGNEITTVINENFKTGTHVIPVETDNLAEGIYFYTLKKDHISRSMKMIVSE